MLWQRSPDPATLTTERSPLGILVTLAAGAAVDALHRRRRCNEGVNIRRLATYLVISLLRCDACGGAPASCLGLLSLAA